MDRRTFFKLIPALAAISHTQRLLPCSAAGNILPFPLNELRKTSIDNPKRNALPELKYIQDAADACTAKDFDSYCTTGGEVGREKHIKSSILNYFRVDSPYMLRSIKNVHPRRGKTQLFLLYKIGYDVETPSTTFGIDIFHPRASKFADKLNFLLISTTAMTTILNLFRNPKEQRHPITSNFVDTFASLPRRSDFHILGKSQ